MNGLFQWWATFFVIGIFFLPVTFMLFSSFWDKGYLFSKIIGVITGSYILFLLSTLHVLPFTSLTIQLVFLLLGIGIWVIVGKKDFSLLIKRVKNKLPIILFEESMFFIALWYWSYIRSFNPDINGLEKYMDFGFVNSILRTTYFPPADMWFTPLQINYYYFGHLFTAVLIKLSLVIPSVGYNLMIATLFAFTFSLAFSIGATLFSFAYPPAEPTLPLKKHVVHKPLFQKKEYVHPLIKAYVYAKRKLQGSVIVIAGLLTGFIMSFSGNLHSIYAFFTGYSTDNPLPFWQQQFMLKGFPNGYWYPNATRFIHNTIHEFPLYSFVVSDLHGHVLSIPIVLTIIAYLLHLYKSNKVQFSSIFFLGFLIAIAYMTNAWDGLIYFLLSSVVIVVITIKHLKINHGKNIFKWLLSILSNKSYVINTFLYIILLLITFILVSLPFSLHFKPFVSGIGVLCSPAFLVSKGHLGPLLFETDHCQHSPLWQLGILHGFFYFWVFIFFIRTFLKKRFDNTEIFIFVLIAISTLLIIVPEFIYAKDIYPAHYRANTMFKLVYQAFIMLSIVSAFVTIKCLLSLKHSLSSLKGKIFVPVFFIIACIFYYFIFNYSAFAINSYYGDLKKNKGLDGITYIKTLYPDDYDAILWINNTIKNQPVILEAQGDSYTTYGRISSNTGLPTVLGWTVHEWLWRGTYDIPAPRIADVQNLYESPDIATTKNLLKKYNVQYVFIGKLEHEKYTGLKEEKFSQLGKEIYKKGQTTIYKINES